MVAGKEGHHCKALCPSHKSINRIWEKICMEPDDRLNAAGCTDIARGGVECDSMKTIAAAAGCFLSREDLAAVRVKNRFLTPTGGGWRDIFINFYFHDDVERNVCEIQLMHTHLLNVREEMNAHY